MRAKVQHQLIGFRAVSNGLAAFVWLASLVNVTPVWASNPWGRAVGEAQGLHDVTEDLRNRANRLFPSSPATRFICVLDEVACQLLDMVKGGADGGHLQAALRSFDNINTQVCRLVAADCHMVRDRTIGNYLRMVDDRFGDLVRDLSKCKPPVPSCNMPYPPRSYPPIPVPYPHIGHDDYPRIPQPIPTPREAYNYDPRFVTPNLHPSIPRQWQGAMPRDYPRSTYDFDAMLPGQENSLQSQVGNLTPVDRRFSENPTEDRPVASEILSFLMSRALR